MKKRTKEEMATYRRELRAKKRVTPIDLSHPDVTPCHTPIVGNEAGKCLSCVIHLENKKLLARIALLETEKKYKEPHVQDHTKVPPKPSSYGYKLSPIDWRR